MVQKVSIENFKSIHKLSLPLGRVNVLIGENGCGKSNILEGIAMGAAVRKGKIDSEFLTNRGVRVTLSSLMRANFDEKSAKEAIKLIFQVAHKEYSYSLNHDNGAYSEWEIEWYNEQLRNLEGSWASLEKRQNLELEKLKVGLKNGIDNRKNEMGRIQSEIGEFNKKLNTLVNIASSNTAKFGNFLIYAPENTFLRKFEEETQVQPVGYKGEGLIKLLKVLHHEQPEIIEKIKSYLQLIGWFQDFEIVDNVFNGSYLKVRDRFLDEEVIYPHLNSVNEGFLYLLFYFTIFMTDYTPKFFAIDNIDNALNPKLCGELITVLAKLAKEHDKQVIFTTHNPAVLDGLDLGDDEQRLFVIYRNAEGHTKARRIFKKEMPEGYEPVKLSEQFLRGYIGGLPKNF